jgi:cytochrome o ubiquinol oxidase subunit 1
MKHRGAGRLVERRYQPIEMPRNSATGFVTSFFAVVGGFALIWHIWWMAIVGVAGIVLTMLAFAWRVDHEVEIPVEDIIAAERARIAASAPEAERAPA